MSLHLIRAGLIAALISTATAQAAPIAVDRVVAVVNKQAITYNELKERVKTVTRQMNSQKIPLPKNDVLETQVLERMVSEQVLLQLAFDTGIRVDDTQLDKTVERIAQQNNMSLPSFRAALAKDGIEFKQFREEIRNEIIISRLRDREVDSRVVVTDAEIDSQMKQQEAQGDGGVEFQLAHILLSIPENASPEQINKLRDKADKAAAEIQKGTNFAQVAASYSDAPDALQGGSLGWRPAGRLPGLFLEQVEKMKNGQTSGVLKSAKGFHIVKLIDKRSKNEQVVIQQTHARHILIRTNEAVSEQEAKQIIDNIAAKLKSGSSFEEIARQQSEDGSAPKGGDLGWLSPGDTVPEFEEAMDKLAPGQLSAPVRTAFGWHLIKVIERRNQDVSTDRMRTSIRQAIRSRKADENFVDWVRQQRDRAYVEMKLEDR
ncbi:peptidyl-prolyl cis-trans isomerase SurA [Chitinivorax tropicus]|uniref:Chaperone SurA n=1 Tax=Chitinivorax tropicus TaxID=714531 RepID=A0A840MM70_9PROT|nr:peptidylprolyl isomerase [Chitinivorax tropicus]MBB5017293.1 peptidyl-prolyl cis-trans isomerase SurA [Chitinivorax tropicus]